MESGDSVLDGTGQHYVHKSAKVKQATCLDKALTAWGWTFDIMTALISLTDVVSDILVAIQFLAAGEKVWGGLVIASLALSNIIYTVFVCEQLIEERKWFRGCRFCGNHWFLKRLVRYSLVFPFAQLFPVINWIGEKVQPSSSGSSAGQWDTTQNLDKDTVTVAVQEEIEGDKTNRKLMERLDKAWIEHMRTHMLFYIETIVESIPQSIIQLLAITFLGQATTLQVFSMSLSLISIVSKGYVVSRSADVQVVVFKFMLAAHDLFSLFYIFSTLIGKEEPKEAGLFGSTDVYVSHLSYGWLISVLIVAIYFATLLIVVGIGIAAYECMFNRVRAKDVGFSFLFVCGCILVSIPVTIAAVGAKLLWLVAFITSLEADAKEFPTTSTAFRFVNGGSSYDQRLLYLAENQVAAEEAEVAQKRRGFRGHRYVNHYTANLRNHFKEALYEKKPFRARQLLKYFYKHQMTMELAHKKGERYAQYAFFVGVGGYTLLQIYTLVFPFISYGLRFSSQNLLQHFCFVAMCIPLMIAMLLTPRSFNYTMFLVHYAYPTQWGRKIMKENLTKWIASYHTPPYAQLVRREVPQALVPMDLIDHCTKFMIPSHVDMRQLTLKECQQLKDDWAKDEDTVGPEPQADGMPPVAGGGIHEAVASGRPSILPSPNEPVSTPLQAGGMRRRQFSHTVDDPRPTHTDMTPLTSTEFGDEVNDRGPVPTDDQSDLEGMQRELSNIDMAPQSRCNSFE